MRALHFQIATAVALFSLAPGVRLSAQDRDPDASVAGGGTVPAGWQARTDKGKPLTDAKIVTMGSGLHVTLGPAVVLWRESDKASGDYHVVATFTQTENPRHPEAYGLFIGGSQLGDAQNRYTYFLVRGDGKFLIKRRVAGDSTVEVSKGWTESDAVVKADSEGKASNELSILVQGGKVSFQVNGKDVYSARATVLDTQGIVGYRVNHNLDVHLSALGIHKL
ncbi:MAG: hypothetical protein ACREMM_12760 [Gemmatimonadales bacterium]